MLLRILLWSYQLHPIKPMAKSSIDQLAMNPSYVDN